MKTRRFLVIPFAVALAFVPQLFAQHGDPGSRSYAAKLLSPKAGDVLVPGQQVTIRWDSRLPDVDMTWCEAEIYLSLDGGRTNVMRITPQLDPRIGYYDWTVPNLPTNAAVLDIHFGCLGYYPQPRLSQETRCKSPGIAPLRTSRPLNCKFHTTEERTFID